MADQRVNPNDLHASLRFDIVASSLAWWSIAPAAWLADGRALDPEERKKPPGPDNPPGAQFIAALDNAGDSVPEGAIRCEFAATIAAT